MRVWASRFVSAKQIVTAESSICYDGCDAFIDVHHSGWVSEAAGNPRQSKIAESGEERGGWIGFYRRFVC